MKMTLTGMGALASLLIGMSGDALADTNTYGAYQWEPLNLAHPFSRGVAFGIGNPSTTVAATYICPLVRDNLPALLPLASAAVVVQDFTTSGAISCTFTSRSLTGGQLGTSTRVTSSPGVGVQTLPAFAALPTSSTGFTTLHCTVPRRATAVGQGTSRVISYRATEV